jgi:hypothetical protein
VAFRPEQKELFNPPFHSFSAIYFSRLRASAQGGDFADSASVALLDCAEQEAML